ncbi:response regulator [Microscilla marina]|uniref:Response regulator n=1 Tax=Microscilla marina ATCC 23134 TaxID=313606 RepID=A1ZYX2_MICM2|nr:response regulator [Microscilla marina]EAY24408.1 response regulator [Microscilla marina ATCC 23134]
MGNTITNQPKVLIIEDDAINAFVLQKFIEKKYTAVLAKNGHEALSLVKDALFDVILMDINLGDENLDGVHLLQKIRAITGYANANIFAVTSFAMRGDKESFLAAGFNRYFSKPIEHSVIMKAIDEAVSSET